MDKKSSVLGLIPKNKNKNKIKKIIEDETISISKTSKDIDVLAMILDLEASQTNDRWICSTHWSENLFI